MDTVANEAVSRLLRSICIFMEMLKAHPGDERRPHKLVPSGKLASELQELKESMLRILGALLEADLQRSPDARALVLQARDAVYSLEDVEDMLQYRWPLSKVDPPTRIGRNSLRLAAYLLRKHLIVCLGGVASSFPKQAQLRKHLHFVVRESSMLLQLMERRTSPLCFSPSLLDSPNPGTQLALRKHELFGRDRQFHEILRMLTDPCRHPEPEAISIVGVAGLGKTTLAQLVYNDATVLQQFDVRSWVFVSTVFDRTELATEILRSAQPAWVGADDKMLDGMPDFEMLQSEIQRFVAHKKSLIVLDDLQDVAAYQDILTSLLRSAGIGSRILVTARTETVLPHMLGACQVYRLNPLCIDDCWSLINEHTFCTDTIEDYPELKQLGREIAGSMQGLPLAAKMVGNLLLRTRSLEAWKNIQGTLIQDGEVLSPLRLSYNHLPAHLKRCFAYCSLFPKNSRLDPEHLIRLWVAQGFVHQTIGVRVEDMAREYFDQLLSRSFFQELKLGSDMHFLMHDLVHDLAASVAAEDCFRIERATDFDIPLTVRHLSVTVDNIRGLVSFPNLNRLRTLLVMRSFPFTANWFELDLLKLRVLDLSGCNLQELPRSIGNLPHLRYLSIRSTTLQRLPESIGKLRHLQFLCLSDISSLEKLPTGINNLVNLRHLGVAAKHTAGLVGIRRLINLQGSLEFNVEKLEGRTLEELRNINGLRGLLKIKGLENVSGDEQARRAELNKKQYLNSLNLEWGSTFRKLHPPADAEVLEGLVPHENLKELRIRRYCGTKAPSWLRSPLLQYLRSLYLMNCRDLAILPPLGHLRSLKTLHMRELSSVVRIGDEFYGTDAKAFPSLRILELDDFPKLREWCGIEDKKTFPCLERLMLMDCPALAHIPSLPQTTTEFAVERTQLISYLKLSRRSSCSERLQLDVCARSELFMGLLNKEHILSIVALNISGSEQCAAAKELCSLVSLQWLQLSRCSFSDQTFSSFLQALPCVSSLEMVDLPNIKSIPILKDLKLCTMLKELCIRNCQLLCSLSSLQFLCSLRYLVIERCPKVTAASFPINFDNLTSLKILRISNCSGLQSLPVSGLPPSLETVHVVGCHPELCSIFQKH